MNARERHARLIREVSFPQSVRADDLQRHARAVGRQAYPARCGAQPALCFDVLTEANDSARRDANGAGE